MSQTDLKFYRFDENTKSYIPLGSARGCRQTLEPLIEAQTFRTIKGNLVSLSHEEHQQKYFSFIECDDLYPVSFEGLWPGTKLWIECIPRLMTPFIEKGGGIQLKRTYVQGSLLLHKEDAITIALPDKDSESHLIQLRADQGPGHISYRPLLCMIMKNFSIKVNEWERIVGWRMDLEEV